MKKQNTIQMKLSKEDKKISVIDPSKLLADYFNGVVINLNKEYIHE